MLERNLRPSDILTKKSFENAIVVVNALGRAQGIPKDHRFGISVSDSWVMVTRWLHKCSPAFTCHCSNSGGKFAWNMRRFSLLNISFRDVSGRFRVSKSIVLNRGKLTEVIVPEVTLPFSHELLGLLAKIELTIDDFQRISAKTALIADLKPSGKFRMEETWGT